MSADSPISWTKHTFNPWWGCVKVSDECDGCYAETFSASVGYGSTPVDPKKFPIWGQGTSRRFFGDKHWDLLRKLNKAASLSGQAEAVFCASMADIMEEHPELPPWRQKLWGEIDLTEWLTYLLLTKRPQNFRRFFPKDWLEHPRRNVIGMTTVGVRKSIWRIRDLQQTPFVARWLSCEPLLEDLGPLDLSGIDGVIVGGESGHRARPMHPDWARSLRDQCIAAGVAFHFKQWGEWCPRGPAFGYPLVEGVRTLLLTDAGANGSILGSEGGNAVWMQRAGVKRSGRILDGRTWDEMPEVRHA